MPTKPLTMTAGFVVQALNHLFTRNGYFSDMTNEEIKQDCINYVIAAWVKENVGPNADVSGYTITIRESE